MTKLTMETEPTLRSVNVLKAEAEEIGLVGQDIIDYVREQQKEDREERAAWRDAKQKADDKNCS